MSQRIITTKELARFYECRLAWWYDREYPLSSASADELARRLDLLKALHGADTEQSPEYLLLKDLHGRAAAIAEPTPAQNEIQPSQIHYREHPQTFMIIIAAIAAILLLALLAGLWGK